MEYRLPKLEEPGKVEWHPMVALPSSNDARQPPASLADGGVATFAKLFTDRRKGAAHAASHSQAAYDESAPPSPITDVSEPEEVESLALAVPGLAVAGPTSLPELDQSSFLRV